jgi:hypothetical protein
MKTEDKYSRDDFWKDPDNVHGVLLNVVEEHGKMPTMAELQRSHRSLASAVMKYHGGYAAACDRLGYETSGHSGFFSSVGRIIGRTRDKLVGISKRYFGRGDIGERGE